MGCCETKEVVGHSFSNWADDSETVIRAGNTGPRKAIVIVNPYSGSKKGKCLGILSLSPLEEAQADFRIHIHPHHIYCVCTH